MTEMSCFNCKYLRNFSSPVRVMKEIESWEMPHIYWYECMAREANAMLKQFPFKRTTCKFWEKDTRPMLWQNGALNTLGDQDG